MDEISDKNKYMWSRSNTIPADWGDAYTTIVEGNKTPAPIVEHILNNATEHKKTVDGENTLSFGEYSLSIEEVYRDIKRLTLTRNPFDLIFKANEIREKFAFFINSLANFISKSFSSFDNDSFINELYHDSKYHCVWLELASQFLRDAHYCSEKFDMVVSISTPGLQVMANANKSGEVLHVFCDVSDPVASGVGITGTAAGEHPAHE